MKKLFLLIGLIFLLCGCAGKAEVNIKIDKDELSEKVDIDAYTDDNTSIDNLNNMFLNYFPVFNNYAKPDKEPDREILGVDYYNKFTSRIENGYHYTYSFNYNLIDYNNSYSLKNAFKSAYVELDEEENLLTFYTDKNGMMYFSKYPGLSEVIVNIEATFPVKNSNADSIDGNVYSWKFTRDDYVKNIYIEMSTSNENNKSIVVGDPEGNSKSKNRIDEIVNRARGKSNIIIPILFGCFFLILIIVHKISRRKYK